MTGTLLLCQCQSKLFFGDDVAFNQQLTQTDFFSALIVHDAYCNLPCFFNSLMRSLGSLTSAGQSLSETTSGRSRMTSSIVLDCLRSLRNNLPTTGMSPSNGVL